MSRINTENNVFFHIEKYAFIEKVGKENIYQFLLDRNKTFCSLIWLIKVLYDLYSLHLLGIAEPTLIK